MIYTGWYAIKPKHAKRNQTNAIMLNFHLKNNSMKEGRREQRFPSYIIVTDTVKMWALSAVTNFHKRSIWVFAYSWWTFIVIDSEYLKKSFLVT